MTRPAGLAIVAVAAGLSLPALAGEGAAVNTGYFGNVAIEGYDPVAYFTEGQAVRGTPDHAYEWLGAEWHFSNGKHMALFADDPISYAPQYGGLCADGIAYGGMTVNIDPEAFTIIDGKLYLNADIEGRDELVGKPGQVERSKENWPEVEKRFLGN